MSCDCQGPLPVDPLISRSPISRSREVGAVGPTGPTGTVADMNAPAGPWSAIVTQEICPGVLPPILSANIRLGFDGTVSVPRLRHGTLELWTAADDNLTRGAWIAVSVDRDVLADRGLAGGFFFFSSDTEPVNESTAAAFAPRLVRTILGDKIAAAKISAGYGDITVLEMWGVDPTELRDPGQFNTVFFAELGCEPTYWSDTTRVGALVQAASSRQVPLGSLTSEWEGASFAFDVPTSHILPPGSGEVALLRQAMRFSPGVVPALPTGATSLPASTTVARLTEAVVTGKTSVFRVTGPALSDRCAIPDGPFWHEQAIVRSGPLAVDGMLHKITAKFSSPFAFGNAHPEPLGSFFTEFGILSGFQHAPPAGRSLRIAYISGQPIDFLPVSGDKRLLPRNYYAGPVQGPTRTFSEINNNPIGTPLFPGPADYDVEPVIHSWLQTPLRLNTDISETIRIFFTFQLFLIWHIRATTGGWTGNRRYSRHYQPEIRSVRLTFADCDVLAAGGSVTKELRVVENFIEFSDIDDSPTVELSISEYLP